MEGKPWLLGRIDVGEPVRVAAIDQEERSLIAATENGRLMQYDLKTLEAVSGPHRFNGIVEEIVHVPNEPAAVASSTRTATHTSISCCPMGL